MKEKSDIVYDTTVVIAEDELLVRIGIKSSVDWEKNGFKLLGEAADGNEAIQMVRKFLPHILLLDIKMPGMSGLDILKIIQLEKIPTKVIIISGLDDIEQADIFFAFFIFFHIYRHQISGSCKIG